MRRQCVFNYSAVGGRRPAGGGQDIVGPAERTEAVLERLECSVRAISSQGLRCDGADNRKAVFDPVFKLGIHQLQMPCGMNVVGDVDACNEDAGNPKCLVHLKGCGDRLFVLARFRKNLRFVER